MTPAVIATRLRAECADCPALVADNMVAAADMLDLLGQYMVPLPTSTPKSLVVGLTPAVHLRIQRKGRRDVVVSLETTTDPTLLLSLTGSNVVDLWRMPWGAACLRLDTSVCFYIPEEDIGRVAQYLDIPRPNPPTAQVLA